MMSAVAIIPARGGSQRVPLKNIRPFFGRPVIVYSILAAARSGLFDRIVVSTDSLEIQTVAREHGAMVMSRSVDMARDEVGTQEVTRDAIMKLYPHADRTGLPDFTCCIYPCAPTLKPGDLTDAKEMFERAPCQYVKVDGMFYWGRTVSFLGEVPLEGNSLDLPWNERWIDINEVNDFHLAAQVYLKMGGR